MSGKMALGSQPVATALIEVSAPHIITLFLFYALTGIQKLAPGTCL